MKDRDKIEKTMKHLLKVLAEQEPPSGAQPTPTLGLGLQAQSQAQAQQAQPQALQPIDPGTKVKYLSTIDMFTSNYPPDSSEWTQETDKKPQFRPLQDGRIVNSISKLFPTMKVRRASAARYSDAQFRVILFGDLKAPTKIKIETTGRKDVEANLESIKIDNRAGLLVTGHEEVLNTLKAKKVKLTGLDLDDMMKWSGITPEEAAPEGTETPPKEPEPTVSPKKVVQKIIDQGPPDNAKVLSQTPSSSKEIKSASPTASKKGSDPTKHKYYSDLITLVQKYWEVSKKDAIRFAKNALSDKDPQSDSELYHVAVDKGYFASKKEESLNLHSYLKSILLEKKNELETGRGGEIVSILNDEIYDEWFSGKGIAAPITKRLFKGNIYEWFAADSATFVPEKRIVEKVKEGKQIEMTLEGHLVMEAEIWIDARLGERGSVDRWTFRVLGKDAPVKEESFKTPGAIKKAGSL